MQAFHALKLRIVAFGACFVGYSRLACGTAIKGCDFYAWLRFGGKAEAAALNPAQLAERRMGLLKQSLVEIRTQKKCLIAGEPELANGHLANSPGS
jgi:hypothetical protein